MHIVEVNSISELEWIKPRWNSLLRESSSETVFLTHEWLITWWENFASKEQLKLLAVLDKGHLLALAPFMIKKSQLRKLPVKELAFVENDETPRTDILIKNDAPRNKVIELLMKELMRVDQWDIIRLRNIPFNSKNIPLMTHFFDNEGIRFGIRNSLCSPFLIIDDSWHNFIQNKSKHFRKRMRAILNKAKHTGNMSITNIRSLEDFDNFLSKLQDISRKSWLNKCRKDMFGNHRRRDFFVQFSRIASRKGWLSVWVFEIDGTALAYEYHLEYGNTVHALRAGYKSDYEYLSPGFVLECNIIKNCFENHVNEKVLCYDLCGSADFYKTRWTPNVQKHLTLMAFNRNSYGNFLYNLEFSIIEFLKNKFKKKYQKESKAHLRGMQNQGISAYINQHGSENERRSRLIFKYGISNEDAKVLASKHGLYDYFEECCRLLPQPNNISKWIKNEVLSQIRKEKGEINDCCVSPEHLTSLITMTQDRSISRKIAKAIFKEMCSTGQNPRDIIKRRDLAQITDKKAIELLVSKVMSEHAREVQEYREGKTKLIDFFVGEVMKCSNGKVNPETLKEILKITLTE